MFIKYGIRLARLPYAITGRITGNLGVGSIGSKRPIPFAARLFRLNDEENIDRWHPQNFNKFNDIFIGKFSLFKKFNGEYNTFGN